MSARLKIETTHADYDQLAHLLDARNRSGRVDVPREILWRLFRDHAALLREVGHRVDGDQ